MNLQFSIGMTSNPRTWPILDGTVKPDGIDLNISIVLPSELFWRQLRFAEFDVSEMSISSLMMTIGARRRALARAAGLHHALFLPHLAPWCGATPASTRPPTSRASASACRNTSRPRRCGRAACCSTNSALRREDMEFWMERTPEHSHAGATGFKPPPGVDHPTIPPEKSIGSMLLARRTRRDADYFTDRESVDRSTQDLSNHPQIAPLFPDPIAEGTRYYRKTGLYPINHGMIVREHRPERALDRAQPLPCLRPRHEIANASAAHVQDHLASGQIALRRRLTALYCATASRPTATSSRHGAIFGRAGPDPAPDEARRTLRPERDGYASAGPLLNPRCLRCRISVRLLHRQCRAGPDERGRESVPAGS